MWELEEKHIHEKHQLSKRHVKELCFMQRHQMIIRHEKELDQIKKWDYNQFLIESCFSKRLNFSAECSRGKKKNSLNVKLLRNVPCQNEFVPSAKLVTWCSANRCEFRFTMIPRLKKIRLRRYFTCWHYAVIYFLYLFLNLQFQEQEKKRYTQEQQRFETKHMKQLEELRANCDSTVR